MTTIPIEVSTEQLLRAVEQLPAPELDVFVAQVVALRVPAVTTIAQPRDRRQYTNGRGPPEQFGRAARILERRAYARLAFVSPAALSAHLINGRLLPRALDPLRIDQSFQF
jgi:hypothetical protein